MGTTHTPIRLRPARRPLTALGLMSGTSLDGVDAAVLVTDGETISARGPALTVPYDPAFRARLRGLLGHRPTPADADVIGDLTALHAAAVNALRDAMSPGSSDIDVVGFHGHTVLHRPHDGETWQIGDGQVLADMVGLPVVYDFRSADVAAGGQGAPFASLYHAAMAKDLAKPLAVLNVGGVANVTWLGADGTVIAFDTGPGNALIDDWVQRHTGQLLDVDGALARGGRIDEGLLTEWLAEPFFHAPPPKSLDRESFAYRMAGVAGLSPADGAATLTAFTARTVALARHQMPAKPTRWLVCGGGRRNGTLMAMLATALEAPVGPVETAGWDGDSLEAEAFAFLAVRSLSGLPLSLPTTTGVPAPQSGGRLAEPQAAWASKAVPK